MALVSITEAARLVRKNRSTLYRDIERGRLSKTVSPAGETQIDTSELLRTYGRLHGADEEEDEMVGREQMQIALLEERARSLERALALEAELRRVKDQVTHELRGRLADKENMIKVLESKLLFLEYDRQVQTLQPGTGNAGHAGHAASATAGPTAGASAAERKQRRSWWSRLLGRH